MRIGTLHVGIGSAAVLMVTQGVFAHQGDSIADHAAFIAGALHPLLGLDHLLAALASGLLAVRIGQRHAVWLIPACFVSLMLVGSALAAAGVQLPRAEWGVAASVIVLGLIVAMMPRVPLGASAALIGCSAILHGHAHMTDVASVAMGEVAIYLAGIAAATLLIHIVAIMAGRAAIGMKRPILIRYAAAAIVGGFIAVLAVA